VARLRGCYESSGVGNVTDSSAAFDESALQETLASTIDTNGLEVAEGVAHEVDGGRPFEDLARVRDAHRVGRGHAVKGDARRLTV
jgi:hypothetical protein